MLTEHLTQHDSSFSTFHPIRGEQDLFSSHVLDEICVDPGGSMKEGECDLGFIIDREARHFIGLTVDEDCSLLEPTPLVEDSSRIPMFDCRCHAPKGHPLHVGGHFARRVIPSPIAAPSYCAGPPDQIAVTFHLGQLGGNGNYQTHDVILSSPEHTSLSRTTPNFHIGDSMLLSPHVGTPLSSPSPQGTTPTDRALGAKQAACSPKIRRSRHSKDQILPEDFVPGPYSVIIDRRKHARQVPGNQRL